MELWLQVTQNLTLMLVDTLQKGFGAQFRAYCWSDSQLEGSVHQSVMNACVAWEKGEAALILQDVIGKLNNDFAQEFECMHMLKQRTWAAGMQNIVNSKITKYFIYIALHYPKYHPINTTACLTNLSWQLPTSQRMYSDFKNCFNI